MGFVQEWKRRIAYWRRRDELETELEEEMRFHLACKAEAVGEAAARRQFGNATGLRERSREVWGWGLVESMIADVRYAWRGLRKSPGFAAIAIGTLAVAIGGGTAIVSLAEAILLRPLPYPKAEELTLLFEGDMTKGRVRGDTAPGTFRALRESMHTMRDLALYQPNELNLSGVGEPERLVAALASANFFRTVGVQPHLGRFFRDGEDEPGKNHVAVLSYELWQRRFGGDPGILNQTIHLSETPHTVIGILPPEFRFYLKGSEVWTPFALAPAGWSSRGSRYIYVTGRRAPGTKVSQVQAELDTLCAQFRRDFPREYARLKLEAVSMHDRLTEDSRGSIYFLLAAVFGLLLIACANVAGLLLTRAVARGAELSVRTALGASSGRLVRQLATEALVLATLAGAASLLVAGASFQLLQPLVPAGMLAFTHLDLNPRVIGIQFALALFCTLVSGVLPAFRIAGVANTRSIGGRHHERVRGALIVTEVALAIILLTGAALLFQTFRNLNGVNPGFRQEGLITAQISFPRQLERDPALRTRLYQDIIERVRAIPGVQNAAFTSAIPTTWKGGFSSNTPEGKVFQPGLMFAMMRQVTPEYFDVMKIPLRQGRLFAATDHAKSELVAVVNEAAARQYWPGENPIGKRLHRGDPQTVNPWITVIGVVGNVRELGLAADAPPITYYPESQHPTALFSAPAVVVARTAGEPAAYGNALRAAVLAASPNQPVSEIRTVETILGKETEDRRIQATITVAFAAVALFLACLGIYGVLAYAVAQRRQEFGVRLALGASPGQLAGLVMSGGLRLTLTGVLIGVSAAAGLTRFMESLLFQVRPLEPGVFAAVTGVLFATAMLACWFPARRAQRVEPAQALRCQ